MQDVVRELGYLGLGSRFKRIGDRLQADVQRLIDTKDLPVQASQYPLLVALDRYGPMTVGQIVQSLGVSQPGVTRNLNRLVERGLVEIERISADQRKKTVSLTAQGQDLTRMSEREIWPFIEAALREICDEKTGPLLDQLSNLENELIDTSLDKRIARLTAEAGR